MDIDGKVAIVTGGAVRLCKALALLRSTIHPSRCLAPYLPSQERQRCHTSPGSPP